MLFELHRHIEGSLRPETILELGRQFRIPLPADSLPALLPHITVGPDCRSLNDFLEKFRWIPAVLGDLSACARVAAECVEDAVTGGIGHLELRFSPAFMAAHHRLDPSQVAATVAASAHAAAAASGLPLVLIASITRSFGPRIAGRELAAILENRAWFSAVDLAGDELNFPAGLFEKHFDRVRDAGLAITIHAGEADGPWSVREAIDRLGATRIGHATRAIEDFRLLDMIGERGIGLECCLTSNVQTGAVPCLRDHPLRQYLDAGLLATINADDPSISGTTLLHEWEYAAPAAGLEPRHLQMASANARAVAYGPANTQSACKEIH